MRRLGLAVGALLAAAGACVFHPDLSRFSPCDAQGACPAGATCLVAENLCLPDCGEGAACASDGGNPGTGTDGGANDGGANDGGSNDGGSTDAGTGVLVLSPQSPDAAVETAGYAFRFQASGGTPPYAFSSVNPLPSGLTLDAATGTLSGKPALAGDFSLTLEVTDQSASPQRSRQGFTLHVLPLLRLAGPGILADIQSSKPYAEQVSATGGTLPYHFELVAGGTLPAGIVLHENGQLDGTSTVQGGSAFDVRVTDSSPTPQVATRSIQVTTASCSFLCVRTRSVPDARVGTAYAYALQTAGGTGSAVTWSLDAGALPPGIQLDAASGVLSGTPTAVDGPSPHSYDFTVSASDFVDKKSVALTLKVF